MRSQAQPGQHWTKSIKSSCPAKQSQLYYWGRPKVGPAVVHWCNSYCRCTWASGNPLIERFGSELPPQQRVQRGTGSGFIISSDGRILTCHVWCWWSHSRSQGGRSFAGKVIGADPVTDVAVIEANGLPTVEPANSDNIVVGQWTIAIGNFYLNNTVTQGIISATGVALISVCKTSALTLSKPMRQLILVWRTFARRSRTSN